MNRRILMVLGVLVAMAMAPGLAAAAKHKKSGKRGTRYYLALGDSLSQGQQPNVQGQTVNTNQGYANDLYQVEHRRIRSLKLVKLGCGGETTQSMITGKGNKDAKANHCHPKGGSQLAAAVRFLKAHHKKGEVPLLTIDIGANDVDGCPHAPNVVTCAEAGIKQVNTDLPKILKKLRAAAPKGTRLVGMNLYDPVLGDYFSPNPKTKQLSAESVALTEVLNRGIQSDDKGAGFLTADVADAFSTYNSTTKVTWEDQQIPLNVDRVCAWTWGCSTPPSGPNIHANKNGYLVMAGAFTKVVGRLR
jgi:lysophospholipase L1-like esterase